MTLAGIYFFLKSIKNPKFLIHTSLFFSLTFLAYQGAKLSTAIVVFILTLSYWSEVRTWLKSARSRLAGSIALGILVSLPILVSLFQGKTGRLEVFSVFSYPRPKEYLENFLAQGDEKVGHLSYDLFHSESLNFTRGILGRWFNHYSGRFLFFQGDWQNPRHSAPNQGVLTHLDLILLIVGFVGLIRFGRKKASMFVWLWLILAPLPAVLSRDQVHAIRSYNLIIPLTIIVSLGAYHLWTNYKKLAKSFNIIYAIGYAYFLDSLFVHLPVHDSQYWEYGYKQVVETVIPIQDEYRVIKIRQSFAQPYIYFLFFQKYDPAKYQKQAKLVASEFKLDVGHVESLDNICFCPIDWSINRGESGTLFVADPIRIPPEDSKDESLFNVIHEIKYLNGRDTAFRIIEVK